MAHLIQPLDVDGTVYCLDQFGGRATEVINTEIITTPTDLATFPDTVISWEMSTSTVADEFEVSFGVGCGSEIELSFEIDGSPEPDLWAVNVDIYVNGILNAAGLNKDDSDGPITTPLTYPVTVSISDVPCGSVITIVTNNETDETGTIIVTGTISSIT